MTWNLTATISGPEVIKSLHLLHELEPYKRALPAEVRVEYEKCAVTGDWHKALMEARRHAGAYWSDHEQQVLYQPKSEMVLFSLPNAFSSIEEALTVLEPLPFEICSLGAAFFDEWIAADYPRWGFDRSMIDLGWGCAFRGAGHDRLASRRWLDFGPWRGGGGGGGRGGGEERGIKSNRKRLVSSLGVFFSGRTPRRSSNFTTSPSRILPRPTSKPRLAMSVWASPRRGDTSPTTCKGC
jgi:hypothetical protein